ncbi:MAG: thioredoxin family protein [Planctomycetes bacterium]|nr:thioredoxin family protein [Planctomycetota bacterium]MCC7396134.1 thioredoxin family protein [Planctomycetota bacterium]
MTCFVLPLLLQDSLVAQENTEKEVWIQDFAKAKAQAKAEKKDLLIDFTGSDWCIWCKRLDKEVFAQAQFQSAAPKDFILVKLDFPQDESLVTAEIKAQNTKLQEQYSIQGFPTVLLTDCDGVVYAQTGYEQGGAEPYVAKLAEWKKQGAVFQAAMLRAADKKGAERAKALDEALSALDGEVVDNFHFERMQEIVAADADGKLELKAKYTARVEKILESRLINTEARALQEMIGTHMEAGEGEQALSKLDEVIKAPKNKVQHQLALFFKGMVTMDTTGDVKAAIGLLEEAKKILPESPIAQRIDQVLPELQKQAGEEK